MVNEAMERALQFLRNHKDVALATSEDNIPKLRIFQVMKQEGNVSVRCSGMEIKYSVIFFLCWFASWSFLLTA